jgi:diketogulonate reductase-like aldo/keto reductase
MLMHWPGTAGIYGGDKANEELRYETWRALEEFHEMGVLKTIGVSNF